MCGRSLNVVLRAPTSEVNQAGCVRREPTSVKCSREGWYSFAAVTFGIVPSDDATAIVGGDGTAAAMLCRASALVDAAAAARRFVLAESRSWVSVCVWLGPGGTTVPAAARSRVFDDIFIARIASCRLCF